MSINLNYIENELKKRLKYPYVWGRKQNDYWDALSNFIYKIDNFEQLVNKIELRFNEIKNREISYDKFFNYSINRWYNFWSARAIEHIFCSLPEVTPFKNNKDRLVDFQIKGIKFDHKTSIFPKYYPNTLKYAQSNPVDLIEWLYKNQSKQQREHYKNRLFIVLYSHNGEHWKLKSEIKWLQNFIVNYVSTFDLKKIFKFRFNEKEIILSDIIWAIKKQ